MPPTPAPCPPGRRHWRPARGARTPAGSCRRGAGPGRTPPTSRPTSLRSASSRSNSSARRRGGPAARRSSTSQKEQGRNAPSPGGQPVDRRLPSARSGSTKPSSHELALDRLDGADDARVVAGRKPTSGIISRLASSVVRAVGLREACRARASKPARADLVVDLVAQRAPAVDRARRARTPRRLCTARSNGDPGHHLRVGEVPARRRAPPRCPRRARCQCRLEAARAASAGAPRRRRRGSMPGLRGQVQRVDHLAVDVELELVGGGVADRAPGASPRSRAASRARTRAGGARRRRRT